MAVNQVTRREFVKKSSVAAGAAAVASGYWTGLSAAPTTSANEQLNIACIGTANRASANIGGVGEENLVAFCDIDRNYLDQITSTHPEARTYVDYRELLDTEANESTPSS